MVKPLLTLLSLALLATTATAADTDRQRKVRVALALSGPPAATAAEVAVAPPPRSKPPQPPQPLLTYADGYKKATTEQLPLVIFVGCDGHPVGDFAVATSVLAFGTVEGPAAVVGFPRGDQLHLDSTLRCPVKEAELKAAIEAAAKKIDGTAAPTQAAPKPLEWQIRRAKCSYCGDSCNCGPGRCPNQCAVAAPATTVVGNCVGGQCRLQPTGGVR